MLTEITPAQTFLDAVQRSAAGRADRPALTFLVDGEPAAAQTWSFADLDRAARIVAADLQAAASVRPGDRVLLLQTPGWDMVAGFLGCVYAGAIAVPAYPPTPFMGTRGAERLRGIWSDAGATAAITTSALVPLLEPLTVGPHAPSWVLTDAPASPAGAYAPVEVAPGDVAFLQYTSGSTADPRGVRVTHAALMANIEMIRETCALTEDTVACSWLPPFHDMGLIAKILTPLAVGFRTVQMAPEAFLRRPDRWLRAITHYRAGFSWAPNFAYEQCIRRIDDTGGIDLSCWTVAGNGAEPVRERTVADFAEKFARCGLRPGSLWAGYGLAEATLLVAARRREPGSTIWAEPEELGRGRIVPVDAAAGRPLVSCGPPAPRTVVTVWDPATGGPAGDGIVGEIRVSGPQVGDGYWGRPDLSSEVFPGGVLRTGDLGAFWRGELYVTGRAKDLIVIRGRNHYPQDIEQTMDFADPALRPGCGVAVSVPADSGELLVLISEVAVNTSADLARVAEKVRRLVAEQHGVAADAVVLIRPRTIPKTTSGKLRRSSAGEAFLKGTLRVVHQWTAAGGWRP